MSGWRLRGRVTELKEAETRQARTHGFCRCSWRPQVVRIEVIGELGGLGWASDDADVTGRLPVALRLAVGGMHLHMNIGAQLGARAEPLHDRGLASISPTARIN